MGEAVVVQGARAGQGLAALLTGVPEGVRGLTSFLFQEKYGFGTKYKFN